MLEQTLLILWLITRSWLHSLLHEVVEGPEEMEAFAKQLEASFLQNSPCAMGGSKKLIQGESKLEPYIQSTCA